MLHGVKEPVSQTDCSYRMTNWCNYAGLYSLESPTFQCYDKGSFHLIDAVS
jgi:hypothetical protein